MFKVLFYIFLLSLSIFGGSTIEGSPLSKIAFPEVCKVGQKAQLTAETTEQLPASSFYRVEFSCSTHPQGAHVKTSPGFPTSDVQFDTAGDYVCEAELGILTKSSCAGVQYRSIKKEQFNVKVLEHGL